MKILITGGAGFIGSAVVDRLAARGDEITVFDDLSTGRRENLERAGRTGRLHLVEGDVRDEAALAACVGEAELIVHLAALVSVPASIARPRDSFSINALGGFNVFELARRHPGVRGVVYASSAAVYGDAADLPIDEDRAPLRPMSPYAADKAYLEQLARAFFHAYGLRSLGLRFFNVYGPRQLPGSPYSGVISKFAEALCRGGVPEIFGDGGQTRDFVYVGDVAEAVVAACDRCVGATAAEAEVTNVGSGSAISVRQLHAQLCAVFGVHPEARFIPAKPGDIRHSLAATARAQRLLGWSAATPLAQGLAQLRQHLLADATA